MKKLFILVFAFSLLQVVGLKAQTPLFEFSTPFTDSASSWTVYTDQAMGGNTMADIVVSDTSVARFGGTLSFANRGGIAQTISPYISGILGSYEGITIRFKGDGTPFIVALQNVAMPCSAKHLEYLLRTEVDQWTEVQIPFSEFRNTYFGVAMIKHPLSLNDVHHVSFINAYQEGPFWIDIDWVKLF